MGWLSMTSAGMAGHANPKAYLDDQFTYGRALDGGGTRGLRVIDSAFVGNRVWYAAAEIIRDGEPQYVIALVCLVGSNRKAKKGHVFAYKITTKPEGYARTIAALSSGCLSARRNAWIWPRHDQCKADKRCIQAQSTDLTP